MEERSFPQALHNAAALHWDAAGLFARSPRNHTLGASHRAQEGAASRGAPRGGERDPRPRCAARGLGGHTSVSRSGAPRPIAPALLQGVHSWGPFGARCPSSLRTEKLGRGL